jgi:hypothetical protein
MEVTAVPGQSLCEDIESEYYANGVGGYRVLGGGVAYVESD